MSYINERIIDKSSSDRDENATAVFCLIWAKTLGLKDLSPLRYNNGEDWYFKHMGMRFSGDVMNNDFNKGNPLRYSIGNLWPLPTNTSKPSLNSWKAGFNMQNIHEGKRRDRMDEFLVEVKKFYDKERGVDEIILKNSDYFNLFGKEFTDYISANLLEDYFDEKTGKVKDLGESQYFYSTSESLIIRRAKRIIEMIF